MKYYHVEELKELYAESYDLIPDKYKDLKDRGYDSKSPMQRKVS